MGSNQKREEVNVLVTGFGPFKSQYPVNPSWAIASSLPTHLPALRVKAPFSSAAPHLPPVKINVHPQPVRVAYTTVRPLVPQLWDGTTSSPPLQNIDLALHIGMAGPKPVYQLERRAHRDGYVIPDVDGKLLNDDDDHSAHWVWHGLPGEIETDVDVERVLGRWRELSPDDLHLKISDNPGRYLCDFIYYSSLAHLTKRGERKRVVFLHVPADASETAIRTGTELVVQLIRALVESELAIG